MSQKVHSFVINLIGTAIQTWELDINLFLDASIEKLQSHRGCSISELLFDLDVIGKLNVKHWTELGKRIGGLELFLNNAARIELRKNGRLAERILIKDLLEPV